MGFRSWDFEFQYPTSEIPHPTSDILHPKSSHSSPLSLHSSPMILDTHQHFWKYDPVRHGWINDEMAVIRRDFLPEELQQVYSRNGVDACVAVQADQTEEETTFLIGLAEQHEFIKGIVGWVDFQADNIEERLTHFSQFEKVVGFRHIVQAEPDPNFLLRDKFKRGIAALHAFGFTYDILIFPHQLGAALELVRSFPLQKFVVDHIAKPYIKDGYFDGWAVLIKEIAKYENVSCKVSGMITEADYNNWTYEQVEPYLELVFEAFGTQRTMFGSDWPVCLVAGSYEKVKGIVERFTKGFSEEEKAHVFWGNGIDFYDL